MVFYQRISELSTSYLNHHSSDDTLFNSVINNPDHVLCSLLPPSKNTVYNLRKLNHGLSLPADSTLHFSLGLQRKNFIYRMLLKDVY